MGQPELTAPQLSTYSRTAPVLAALLVAMLIGLHVAVQRDEAGWVTRGTPHDTVVVDGHLVEWEWSHLYQTVEILEGDLPPPREIASQNAYRFVGAYLIGVLREPLGEVYAAALFATVASWLAAAWGAYHLATHAAGSRWAGLNASVLVAMGPALIGFMGHIDAHQFGYVAVLLWVALVACHGLLEVNGESGDHPWWRLSRRQIAAAGLAGLALCVTGLTMEVAYPLLLFAWLCYGMGGVIRRPAAAGRTLLLMALFAASFAVPYLASHWLAEHVLFEQVVAFNEPFNYVRASLATLIAQGPVAWVTGRLEGFWPRWLTAFPPLIQALALAGAMVIPRRWLFWSLALAGSFCAALILTKAAARDVYLTMPAVYLLAAAGMHALATGAWQLATRWHFPAGRAAYGAVLAALIMAVVLTNSADLWGNYHQPYLWFRVQ